MHHALFLMIALTWGSNFIMMKIAREAFGPISIGAGRTLLGAAVLAGMWWARQRRTGETWPLHRRHMAHVLVLVLIGYVYPYAMQPYLIGKTGNSAFIGMMPALVPLLTIIVSIPMLRVHPTRRQLAGVLGGLGCMVLVFYDAWTTKGFTPIDILYACAVPTTYAVANTYVKRYLTGIPATALSLAALGICAALMLPVGLAVEPIVVTDRFGFAVLMLVIFGTLGTGVATVMFYKLIHDRGPLFAGMVSYIIPIVALLFGVADKEELSATQIIALAGIFAMVALVQFPGKKPPRKEDIVEPLEQA